MSHPPARGLRKGLTRYGDEGFALFLRKAFIKAMGFSDDALDRPIIGVTDTASAYNACHRTVPDIVEAVKRGVLLEGALPLEFPVVSLHEAFSHPTSMFLRNLMAMDVEEMVRAQPMDAVVLVGGCDKTVPALLMGAASADVPAVLEVTGPMGTGAHRGERLGACTDCRRLWAEHRAGRIDEAEVEEISGRLVPSAGTCGVMGTASTMAILAETLGMTVPGCATIPAVHADRFRHAEATGRCAARLARASAPRPREVMTPAAFANALRVLHAIGGSTNGVVHLAALAGRLGLTLDLDGFDRLGHDTPVLVDLKPTGRHYMEDLHRAGGLDAVLRELADVLHTDVRAVDGTTLGVRLANAPPAWPQDVVRPREEPLARSGSIAVLRGTLAPDGAVVKHAAASAELLAHTGRAVVFDSLADLAERIDDPALDVRPDDVLVLRNAGPIGAPGMPEAGYLPIPSKLAAQGVEDMVRISDARMSGTAFGTIVLHASPEAAVGGPLALVRDGDAIRLDVPGRRLDLLVEDAEIERRRAAWTAPAPPAGAERGWLRLWLEHVEQAPAGCDLDFLRPAPTGVVPLSDESALAP